MGRAARLAPQRLARPSDAPRISELIRTSVLELFSSFYGQRQTANAAVHIDHLDMQLIEDPDVLRADEDDARPLDSSSERARTSHVRAPRLDATWSRPGDPGSMRGRGARAERFKKLTLGATLPGEPFYGSFGFREVGRFTSTMPDGVSVECVAMDRAIEPAPE